MNNHEFGKLLKEWKQKKELEENLEEGVLDKLKAGVLGATMATGLASASPAIAAPAKEPAAQTQVQKKKQLKDLVGLNDNQKYLIGVYVTSIDKSLSSNIEETAKKISSLRGLIDSGVQTNPEAEKMLEKRKAENPKQYQYFVTAGDKAIKDGIRYEIRSVNGIETIEKFSEKTDSQEDKPALYGAKAWDDLQNRNSLQEKKNKGDRCVRIAKRKYDVWPSAYASGAVVKCRQGKIWKGLSEEEQIEEKKKPDFKKEKESGLHGWFSRQGGKGKSKGWVDCNTCRTDKKTGKKTCKTCGRKEGEKRSKYPACRPKPSDCGSSGKGEDWGKRSSKKESLQIDQDLLEQIIKEVLEGII